MFVLQLFLNSTASHTHRDCDEVYDYNTFLLWYVFTQRQAFKDTKEKFGGIDIVCNNAGMGNEDYWRKMIEVNLVGSIKD